VFSISHLSNFFKHFFPNLGDFSIKKTPPPGARSDSHAPGTRRTAHSDTYASRIAELGRDFYLLASLLAVQSRGLGLAVLTPSYAAT
jgi:hypothetical protein